MFRASFSGISFLARHGAGLAGLAVGISLAAQTPDALLQGRPVRPEPFAQSPLQFNPPTFRWPAAEAATAYRVELSRDPAFTAPQVSVVTAPFYRPSQPLDAGVWHWRVRAGQPASGLWLGAESFTLSADLPRWPLPDWAELLRRIPAGHPRCYVTSAEIAAWRSGAHPLPAALAGRMEKVRAALARPFSLEAYVARTKVAGDTPEQELKRRIWESKGAARAVSQPAADAAWLWLATQDRSWLEAAKARALQAADLDHAGFLSAASSDFGNAALVENLGLCYDLLYAEFSPAERLQLRTAITVRARVIFDQMQNASQDLMRAHNWQRVFLSGMTGALAIYGEDPVAEKWVTLGLETFVAMYPWFGGKDGGSHEGTRYYHATEMLSSLDTLDFFRAAFGLRLDEGNPWFRANPYYLLYSFPPGDIKAQLGDSNEGDEDEGDDRPTPGGRARAAALRMAQLYGNGHAAAYAAAITDDNYASLTIAELLRWPLTDTVAPQSLAALPSARLFADIGTVFTHSDYTQPENNVRFVFHSSPYGGFGHGHADQNSFHVIAYGEQLLLDSGYYTPAGDPHRQKWTVQTKAHNSVLVDGKGQSYGDTRGYGRITHFEDTTGWTSMAGSAGTAYREVPLDRFDRHVVWLKNAATPTFVVIDDLAAAGDRPRSFDWLLHAARRMSIDTAGRRVLVSGEKGEAAVTFVAPAALTFRQDDQFDAPAVYWRNHQRTPLPDQWHLKASAGPAVRMRFVTVIQISRPGGAKPALRAVADGVETAGWRVRLPEGQTRLQIQKIP